MIPAAFVALFFATGAAAFDDLRNSCSNAIDCAANSVVSLLPDWPSGFSRNEEPEGSGVVLADGTLIVTADHVLGPAKSAKIRTRNGRIYPVEIVLRDSLSDIALLRVAEKLSPIDSSYETEIAAKACAIGNSFGLGISISCGIVSADRVSGTGFNQLEDFVQTDAAVNPGMSGGALVDGNGRFIGLLSAIYTRQSDANIGVNFAASDRLVNHILKRYLEDGRVQHRRPGVLLKPADIAQTNGLIGGEVVRLKDQSLEAEAGLLIGDVIIAAGVRRITDAGSYATAIALAKSGEPLYLKVLRDAKQITITLQPN